MASNSQTNMTRPGDVLIAIRMSSKAVNVVVSVTDLVQMILALDRPMN
jgi:hypothetical protein